MVHGILPNSMLQPIDRQQDSGMNVLVRVFKCLHLGKYSECQWCEVEIHTFDIPQVLLVKLN